MTKIIVASVALWVGLTGMALAQQAAPAQPNAPAAGQKQASTTATAGACRAPLASPASLSSVTGDVQVSRGNAGFSPATNGMALSQGDRVRVGDKGSALLQYGTCRVPLDEPLLATLTQDGDSLLVSGVAEDQTGFIPAAFPLGAALAGGGAAAAGGTAAAVASSGGSSTPAAASP